MSAHTAITREDENQVWRIIRSTHTAKRKLGRNETWHPATARYGTGIRAKNHNDLIRQLSIALNWATEKVKAVLTALLKRRNRALCFTGDGRVVAINSPAKKARAAAIRAGRRPTAAMIDTAKLIVVEVDEDVEPTIPAEWAEFDGVDPNDPNLLRACTRPRLIVPPRRYEYNPVIMRAMLVPVFAPVRGTSKSDDVLDQSGLVMPFDPDMEPSYVSLAT